MKTIRSIVSIQSYRIPPRLKLISTRLSSLILLFQRMPVVQFLFPEASFMGSATVANSVSLAVTTVVGLGVFDTVSGVSPATLAQVSPLANSTTVPAAVGSALDFDIICDADSYPKSWSTSTLPGGGFNTLPNGLTLTYKATTPTNTWHNFITGTPLTAGSYTVTVAAYRYANYDLTDWVDQPFTIAVDTAIITTQPASTSISSGATARLEVVGALGTGTGIAYQWYRGASPSITTPVSGATSAVFTTPALSATTSYWVKVTRNGTVTSKAYSVVANSNTATVTVSASVVSVAVSPSNVLENSGSAMLYTFTRTGSTTSSLTANYTVAGSAIAGTDYPNTTGTVTFAAGSATATVSITPTGDTTVEPNETVTLVVAAGSGYMADATQAIGTITNDDTPYSSWASVLSVSQNGPTQMPMGDGVTNLEKFAFNMEPRSPDVRHLTVGASPASELAGLPAGAKAGVGGVLRLEFLRRKSSTSPGITYTPQFSSNIGTWDDFDGLPVSVSEVGPGTDWERVVVDDPTGGAARFGRVKVIKAP